MIAASFASTVRDEGVRVPGPYGTASVRATIFSRRGPTSRSHRPPPWSSWNWQLWALDSVRARFCRAPTGPATFRAENVARNVPTARRHDRGVSPDLFGGRRPREISCRLSAEFSACWGPVRRVATTTGRSILMRERTEHLIFIDPVLATRCARLIQNIRSSRMADATDIVDHYRSRWIIEEYFKALKTGCSFEKRQLTTYEGLVRALAIFAPLAWRLLALRHLARASRPRPASGLLEDEQLLLLRTLLAKRRYALPVDPTVYDAMLGIAALGGHIKNNGDPGWLVIGRGFTRFVEAEAVWRLARQI
jgi:hypothetical protein